MDAKALAKSKRAHTQHHKKHNPTQKSKAASVGVGGGDVKKESGNQVAEKSHRQRRSPALPSNWDRYGEEFGSDAEDPSGRSTPDVTLPKSKGADFRHLIAEAKAQARADLSVYSDGFPSLDDGFLGDLSLGLGALLSVRGEGLLSTAEDDNFIVDDKGSASHGASLISLNLRALAEKLEKVDLSERLFIEADILPPELRSESSSNRDQTQTTCKTSTDTSKSEKLVPNQEDINSLGRSSPDPILSDEGLISVDQIDIGPGQDSKADHREGPHFARINTQESTTHEGKLSTFEATASEAELDMLLGSLSDGTKLDSSGFRSVKTLDVQGETSTTIPQHFGKSMDSSSIGNNLDDDLDNLLAETSNESRDTNLSQHDVARPARNFQSSSKQEASAAAVQLRRGTDSFEVAVTDGNFDDDLDALLEETSNPTNLYGSTQPQKIDVPHCTQSSSFSSNSEVKDDFDSWLDTL